MNLQVLSIIFALFVFVEANMQKVRHLEIAAKRQAPVLLGGVITSASSASTTVGNGTPSGSGTPSGNAGTLSGNTGTPSPPISSSPSAATSGATSPPATTPVMTGTTIVLSGTVFPPPPSSVANTPPPMATGTGIPPIVNITSGMPTRPADPAATTYAPGASAPISGAPPLPSTFQFVAGAWPAMDLVPDENSSEVDAWMQELEGHNIPDFRPTIINTCPGDPDAANNASARGWWTCGGYTRSTDIVDCPDKLTWGLSFDDGPGSHTQELLTYLSQHQTKATFFVVGSRVIQSPALLIEEYMSGHEISVHTWSHRPLTTLTTRQIVAELGWTRKAINAVLSVTPTTMRPPFGDIDDRVRAISLAMGLIPIIWTRSPSGDSFDTFDWRVAAGQVNGTDSVARFNQILQNAQQMNTGFIVLQHDLFEITVDIAVGYTLNTAMTANPPLKLMPIGQCRKIPATDMYMETTTNKSSLAATEHINVAGSGSAVIRATASLNGNGGRISVIPKIVLLAIVALASLINFS